MAKSGKQGAVVEEKSSEDCGNAENILNGHYGYFKRTMGKDGDQVDVVVAPGCKTLPALYLSNYEKGWQGFDGITEMGPAEFKKWVKNFCQRHLPLK